MPTFRYGPRRAGSPLIRSAEAAGTILILLSAGGCEFTPHGSVPPPMVGGVASPVSSSAGSGDSSRVLQEGEVSAISTGRIARRLEPTSEPEITGPVASNAAAALDVPVSGITRSELRDTYTEARGERTHEAIDIIAPRGTPVLSAADGRVLRIFDSEAGGLMVYATDASERFILLYGHLERYAKGISDGTILKRGQVIGYVGTTGNARVDTPHLHFGVLRGDATLSWWSGDPVNPYPLLRGASLPR